jgi:hypothetical protein
MTRKILRINSRVGLSILSHLERSSKVARAVVGGRAASVCLFISLKRRMRAARPKPTSLHKSNPVDSISYGERCFIESQIFPEQ